MSVRTRTSDGYTQYVFHPITLAQLRAALSELKALPGELEIYIDSSDGIVVLEPTHETTNVPES